MKRFRSRQELLGDVNRLKEQLRRTKRELKLTKIRATKLSERLHNTTVVPLQRNFITSGHDLPGTTPPQKRLRYIRSRMGLTQKEFARLVGLSPDYLKNLEVSEHIPSKTLMILAEVYFARWKRRQAYLQSKAKNKPKIAIPDDPQLKARILSAYYASTQNHKDTVAAIASKLVIRPEVVLHYLLGVE